MSDGTDDDYNNGNERNLCDLYMNGKMNVSGANTKVTINETRATARGYGNLYSNLTPTSMAPTEINTTTAGRGT